MGFQSKNGLIKNVFNSRMSRQWCVPLRMDTLDILVYTVCQCIICYNNKLPVKKGLINNVLTAECLDSVVSH